MLRLFCVTVEIRFPSGCVCPDARTKPRTNFLEAARVALEGQRGPRSSESVESGIQSQDVLSTFRSLCRFGSPHHESGVPSSAAMRLNHELVLHTPYWGIMEHKPRPEFIASAPNVEGGGPPTSRTRYKPHTHLDEPDVTAQRHVFHVRRADVTHGDEAGRLNASTVQLR